MKRILNTSFASGDFMHMCLWANFHTDANQTFAPNFIVDLWDRGGN